jgi:LytS/YehU family sensor histidine kinase
MKTIKKYKFTFVGLIIGTIAGYAYYYYVGCASGTCSITSKPLNSTLYGGFLGGLLFNSFEKKRK